MGKAQSKRSVDITTEVGKEGVAVEEGANKIGKIEDVDQLKPQLNGDANHKDAAEDKENKVVKDEAENEKDNVNEKEAAAPLIENGASGDAVSKPDEKPVENGSASAAEIAGDAANTTATTLDESKVSEMTEATETATSVADGAEAANGDDAAAADQKKPKKEKTKKRWSFRSFSFSKKDKQKPEKKKKDEETANEAASAAVTNGDCEKVLEETVEEAVAGAEKTIEAVAAAAEGAVISDSAKTNGNAETRNGEPTSVPSAAAAEPKPAEEIKQVIEQTIEEAVKSVDELKINVVSKAEVNDVTELQENAPQLEKIEQSIELSDAEPISNTVVTDNSAGLGDNNSTNNNSPPPPLPDNPPPSQASVFAETAMSIDDTLLPAPAHPQPCPIISTTVQSDSVSVGNTKLELISATECVVDEVLADAKNVVEEKVSQAEAQAEAVAVVDETVVVTSPPAPAVEAQSDEVVAVVAVVEDEPIAEPVAVEAAAVVPQELPIEETPAPASDLITEEPSTEPIKDDISNDISSPLQQNSLESLPSPQSLSSETEQHTESEPTPIVDDAVLPPPPPADDNDIANEGIPAKAAEELPAIGAAVVEAAAGANGDGAVESLPNNQTEANNEQNNGAVVAEVKTNGQHVEEAIPSAEEQPTITNGGCKQNGTATLKSEKENGVGKSPEKENPAEISATESVNGDSAHKTIDEIIPSPEKLEKAAAIQQPTAEVIAAE